MRASIAFVAAVLVGCMEMPVATNVMSVQTDAGQLIGIFLDPFEDDPRFLRAYLYERDGTFLKAVDSKDVVADLGLDHDAPSEILDIVQLLPYTLAIPVLNGTNVSWVFWNLQTQSVTTENIGTDPDTMNPGVYGPSGGVLWNGALWRGAQTPIDPPFTGAPMFRYPFSGVATLHDAPMPSSMEMQFNSGGHTLIPTRTGIWHQAVHLTDPSDPSNYAAYWDGEDDEWAVPGGGSFNLINKSQTSGGPLVAESMRGVQLRVGGARWVRDNIDTEPFPTPLRVVVWPDAGNDAGTVVEQAITPKSWDFVSPNEWQLAFGGRPYQMFAMPDGDHILIQSTGSGSPPDHPRSYMILDSGEVIGEAEQMTDYNRHVEETDDGWENDQLLMLVPVNTGL